MKGGGKLGKKEKQGMCVLPGGLVVGNVNRMFKEGLA